MVRENLIGKKFNLLSFFVIQDRLLFLLVILAQQAAIHVLPYGIFNHCSLISSQGVLQRRTQLGVYNNASNEVQTRRYCNVLLVKGFVDEKQERCEVVSLIYLQIRARE